MLILKELARGKSQRLLIVCAEGAFGGVCAALRWCPGKLAGSCKGKESPSFTGFGGRKCMLVGGCY